MAPSRAVLFDLDGTLADTAADLGAAVNHLRRQRGLNELAVDEVRPYASMGARGLLRVGFGLSPEDPGYLPLRNAFLDRYDACVCVETRLFPGMAELLQELVRRRIAWGIVTNKSSRFTPRIVAGLKLAPPKCFYVGDDLRDVQAARAAGMRPVAVEWGYPSPDNGPPREWDADAVIREPAELLKVL